MVVENGNPNGILNENPNENPNEKANGTPNKNGGETDPILLHGDDTNYTLFPIKYKEIYELAKKAQQSIWSTEEIDLSEDVAQFNRLTNDEKHYIKSVLAFFAGSDGVVLENLLSNFTSEVKVPEAQFAFAVNGFMEAVHSETYSTLIDTLITDPREKEAAFRAVETSPTVKRKIEFAKKYMDTKKPFAERCVAFCCFEGILFSGSFCAIFWLKKRGLMPGLTFSNELISRDEGMHTDLGVLIHKTLKPGNRCSVARVKEIISEAVAVESDFVADALPVRLIGMNAEMMKEYVRFVADRLSKDLEAGEVFGARNPFDWMELISLQGKTNFFEKRVSDYALAAPTAGEKKFEIQNDF